MHLAQHLAVAVLAVTGATVLAIALLGVLLRPRPRRYRRY